MVAKWVEMSAGRSVVQRAESKDVSMVDVMVGHWAEKKACSIL